MGKYIVGFTITDDKSDRSVRLYCAGLSDGLDMTATQDMAIKYLKEEGEEIAASLIAGFYVSCSGDLRNRLSWLQSDKAAQKFRNEILHPTFRI